MSETQKLMEEIRAVADPRTGYRIAQLLDIPRPRVSEYVRGLQNADAYTCAKIAEILKRDPLEIIAQVEAEAARTEKKRAYWRSFFSGLKHSAHVVAWLAICGFFGAGWPGGSEAAATTSHNVRLRQRKSRKAAAQMGGFFSSRCF